MADKRPADALAAPEDEAEAESCTAKKARTGDEPQAPAKKHECFVCLEPMQQPMLLACMHVACAPCLADLRASGPRCFVCQETYEPCVAQAASPRPPADGQPAEAEGVADEGVADEAVRQWVRQLAERKAAIEDWRERRVSLRRRVDANVAEIAAAVRTQCATGPAHCQRLLDELGRHTAADLKMLDLEIDAGDAMLSRVQRVADRVLTWSVLPGRDAGEGRFLAARVRDVLAAKVPSGPPLLLHASFLSMVTPATEATMRNARIGRGFVYKASNFHREYVGGHATFWNRRLPQAESHKFSDGRMIHAFTDRSCSIDELPCGKLAVACIEGHVHVVTRETIRETARLDIACTKLRVTPVGDVWILTRAGTLSALDVAAGIATPLAALHGRQPAVTDFEVARSGLVLLLAGDFRPPRVEACLADGTHLFYLQTGLAGGVPTLGPVFEKLVYVNNAAFSTEDGRQCDKLAITDPVRTTLLPDGRQKLVKVNYRLKFLQRTFQRPPPAHLAPAEGLAYWHKENPRARFLHDGLVVFEHLLFEDVTPVPERSACLIAKRRLDNCPRATPGARPVLLVGSP